MWRGDTPSYQLACAVDDAQMGITEVGYSKCGEMGVCVKETGRGTGGWGVEGRWGGGLACAVDDAGKGITEVGFSKCGE